MIAEATSEEIHPSTFAISGMEVFLLTVMLSAFGEIERIEAANEEELCDHNLKMNEDYSTFYRYLESSGVHNFNESVTIGFLGAYGQAQVVLGALPLAVEAVNRNEGEPLLSYLISFSF